MAHPRCPKKEVPEGPKSTILQVIVMLCFACKKAYTRTRFSDFEGHKVLQIVCETHIDFNFELVFTALCGIRNRQIVSQYTCLLNFQESIGEPRFAPLQGSRFGGPAIHRSYSRLAKIIKNIFLFKNLQAQSLLWRSVSQFKAEAKWCCQAGKNTES